MKKLKKIASLLLALVMILSLAPVSAFAQEGEEDGVALEWNVIENNAQRIADKLHGAEVPGNADPLASLKGDVRVSIVLDAPSAFAKGYSGKGAALDPEAAAYRQSLRRSQDDLAKTISVNVLGGEELDVVWNLTFAANIISAVVPAEKIPAIKSLRGVKDVVVETQYEPQTAEVSDDPNMSVASGMTNAQFAWAEGYTGAGSLIAIVDTGLDYKHQSFNPDSLEMSLRRATAQGHDVDLLTADQVAKLWPSLNASQRTNQGPAKSYFNMKVPYGFNYIDKNFNIEHVNDTQGEHGSHVAGIAAANRLIYKEFEDGSIAFQNAISAVRTQGNAPDAQLLVMKVFGQGGGAYDSDYFAAIEDAMLLGADAVNLSLGSSAKGFAYNTTYQEIIDSLTGANIIWTNSAGNSGSWADNVKNFPYLYSDYANLGTGGSPATYSTSMSVASVDNDGMTSPYLTLGDDMIFYTETAYANAPMGTLAGKMYDYVFIDGPGVDDDEHVGMEGDQFMALGREQVTGRIAVCYRGGSSFFAKANAAAAQGATAVILVNNQPGTIAMNLTGYEYRVPVVSITTAEGEILKKYADLHYEASEEEGFNFDFYTGGGIEISEIALTTEYNADYYTMSDFSSFGVPETLDLKPEITTPGGNIYSINAAATGEYGPTGGHDQYENMSGTSMAAPQLAGLVATLAQYYRESGLEEKAETMGLSQRQVLQSLLMSTARPLVDEDGYYYSVMNQGAGLADLEAALNSKVLVLMNGATVDGEVRKDMSEDAADGKVKAELGDDPERTGHYTVEFTLNNFSDEDRYFDLSADFFTQDVFEYNVFVSPTTPLVDEDGNPVTADYLGTWTAPLTSQLTWFLDGKQYIPDVDPEDYDVNGDGAFDENDAQAILEFLAGPANDHVFNKEIADFDQDEKITSYDAYLALKLANQGAAVVPANGKVTVLVHVTLPDIAAYDDNGAYVEGYIFASEKESEDGALGTVHSIPVLGYYGDWSEPPMVDVGSALKYEYGLETRVPYMYTVNGASALESQYFVGTHGVLGQTYKLGGNPVGTDSSYFPARNAVRSDTAFAGAAYTQVRNSVGYKYDTYLINGQGFELLDSRAASTNTTCAYYHVNQGKWMNTSASTSYGFAPTGAEEGDSVVLSYTLAPEYYKDYETGAIAWDEIYPTWVMSFTVDDTEPEISSVFGTRLNQGDANNVILTVSAKDNEYIAGFFVYDEAGNLIYEQGSREDSKEADTPDRQDYVVMLDGANVPDHLEVEIWDYAGNVTTAMINLNKDEFNDPIQVVLSEDEFVSVVGNSVRLSATVYPWGYNDQRVTWTSSDENVATVENGVVLGTGEGTAIITATSVADPTKSDQCEATFISIDRELKGIVWDENGEVWFSSFNTKSLPAYDKLHGESLNLPLASTAYGKDGNLYAASFDSEEFLSTLYTVDEDTFEATEVGDSSIGYMDMAPTNILGRNLLLGVYGPYVVIIDTRTGDYIGYFDFREETGGAELVGIAYEESVKTSYGWSDWYFLVDINGNLISAGFLPYQGSYANFVPTVMGGLGYSTDVPYFQSLYYDGTDLYWSNYVEAENKVNMIFVNDLYNVGAIFNLGSFADGVWPVGGLYNKAERTLIGLNNEDESAKANAVLDESKVFMTEVPAYSFAKEEPAGGVLNSANTSSARPSMRAGDGTEYDDKIVVEIKAAGDENYTVFNGYYEVSFDPEKLVLDEVKTDFVHSAWSEEEGLVKFAFADLDGAVGGDVVATLVFSSRLENYDETEVTVTTCETNNDFKEESVVYTFSGNKDIEVIPYPGDVLANAYTVKGNSVRVVYDIPLKVGYLENGKYVAIKGVKNRDGSYSFEAPEGVESVILVINGDANLDGEITLADSTRIKSAFNRQTELNEVETFAADANYDGGITLSDSTLVKAVFNGQGEMEWFTVE